jgi:hypothetical protein
VIVQGERISAVGQVGTLAVPPGADVISTEGHVNHRAVPRAAANIVISFGGGLRR